MDEIIVKQIHVDQYAYLKGINLGLLMARDLVENQQDKDKLMAASIEINKKAMNVKNV